MNHTDQQHPTATAMFWRYQAALKEGNQDHASACWREYLRTVEQEQERMVKGVRG